MKCEISSLRRLWKEAFGDTDEFLDAFFSTGFSPDRCRSITMEGETAAAAYWLPCVCQGQPFAYIYAVDFGLKGVIGVFLDAKKLARGKVCFQFFISLRIFGQGVACKVDNIFIELAIEDFSGISAFSLIVRMDDADDVRFRVTDGKLVAHADKGKAVTGGFPD